MTNYEDTEQDNFSTEKPTKAQTAHKTPSQGSNRESEKKLKDAVPASSNDPEVIEIIGGKHPSTRKPILQ